MRLSRSQALPLQWERLQLQLQPHNLSVSVALLLAAHIDRLPRNLTAAQFKDPTRPPSQPPGSFRRRKKIVLKPKVKSCCCCMLHVSLPNIYVAASLGLGMWVRSHEKPADRHIQTQTHRHRQWDGRTKCASLVCVMDERSFFTRPRLKGRLTFEMIQLQQQQ